MKISKKKVHNLSFFRNIRKERNFKRFFGQEKARVKLYKSGKQWVKAGIREVQLLKVLGLPFLNKDVEQINNLDTNKDKNFKNPFFFFFAGKDSP